MASSVLPIFFPPVVWFFSALQEPLCGYSKRNIDEDPLRRHCLRQCILGDDGIVYPYFEEWEEQLGSSYDFSGCDGLNFRRSRVPQPSVNIGVETPKKFPGVIQ